jgi:guanylate kinase
MATRLRQGHVVEHEKIPSHHRQGVLFVISGPSGVGKTSLSQCVIAHMCDVRQSVSYTTRAPRPHEQNGREYYFISQQAFEQCIARGAFLEWAQVHQHWYGTSRQQVETVTRAGTDVLLVIDVQGAAQLRTSGVEAVFVFVVPPSWEVLAARLRGRGSETPDIQARRLAVARQELSHYTQYDYVVVNDQLAQAAEVLQAIIIAVRHQVPRLDHAAMEDLLTHNPADQALPKSTQD